MILFYNITRELCAAKLSLTLCTLKQSSVRVSGILSWYPGWLSNPSAFRNPSIVTVLYY